MASASSLDLSNEDSRLRRIAESVYAPTSNSERQTSEKDAATCRARVGKLVGNSWFEACVAVAIVSNSVLIGVEVEWQARHMTFDLSTGFDTMHYVYNAFFVIEFFLRIYYHRASYFYSQDWAWNIMDSFIVLCTIIEMSLLVLGAGAGNRNFSNLRLIRYLRIARLVRSLRLPRIIRLVAPLRALVASIIATLKSLVWAALLLAMIVYVFANIFTMTSIDAMATDDFHPDLITYWANLGTSSLTLFQSISGGINWRDAHRPLSQTSQTLGLIFFMYIVITHFAVLNVVTGMFVNSAIEIANRDPELAMNNIFLTKQRYIENIKQGFRRLDVDGSGCITLVELEELLKDDEIQTYFAAIGLSCDDAWGLFKLLDTSHNHSIDIDEFVEGCLKLKGGAGAFELGLLRHQHTWMMKKLSKFMRNCELNFYMLRCSDQSGHTTDFAHEVARRPSAAMSDHTETSEKTHECTTPGYE